MSYSLEIDALEARAVTEEAISPREFVALTEKQRAAIKSADFVPPRLGDKDFGKVLVRYKLPVYKVG